MRHIYRRSKEMTDFEHDFTSQEGPMFCGELIFAMHSPIPTPTHGYVAILNKLIHVLASSRI
jgi:hypothetical protein